MSFADLIALMPLMILAITPIAVMLVVAVHRSHLITAMLTANQGRFPFLDATHKMSQFQIKGLLLSI